MSINYDLRKGIIKGSLAGLLVALSIIAMVLFLPVGQLGLTEVVIQPRTRPRIFIINVKELDVPAYAPQYSLPINLSSVECLDKIIAFLRNFDYNFSDDTLEKLSNNGFIVISIPAGRASTSFLTNFEVFYRTLYYSEIPVFITVDAVLHIYHVIYASLLRKAEEKYFIAWLNTTISALIEYIQELYARYAEDKYFGGAILDVLAYLYVAKRLLNPNCSVPDEIANLVEEEVSLIMKADSVAVSPLFGEVLDYTLFKPRGYYTSTETLSRYFRTMMWLGYTYFSLKNPRRTLEAILLVIALNKARAQLSNQVFIARDLWEKIYLTTAFFVGYSDDLTVYDYEEAIQQVFGTRFSIEDLRNETKIDRVISILEKKDKSKIFAFNKDRLGFRFMGQRFTPDSCILQNLVDPNVPGRMFPKGLDIMAVFGSNRAEFHLINDTNTYPKYREKLDSLKNEFESLGPSNWTQNLYWGWLYTMKATLRSNYSGFPTFMQTEAWLDEKLTTALGFWVELRHDTILYTKQSASLISITEPMKGYVEPLPQIYNRLLALCNATIDGLKRLGILQDQVRIIERFRNIIKKLLEISIKELQGDMLTDYDYAFISGFGETISSLLETLEDAQAKTPMIADVHTCYDSSGIRVLEEAIGFIDPIIIIYADPSGALRAALGGVFSYYEFISNTRLTDEEWFSIIKANTAPNRPSWIASYHD